MKKMLKLAIALSVVLMLTGVSFAGSVALFSLDIKPQSCPNPVNPASKGVLPVAILGGVVDFVTVGPLPSGDVTEIDPESILLEGVPPLRMSYEDVAAPSFFNACSCTTEGPDGILDLTLKFDKQEILGVIGSFESTGQIPLTLTGTTLDGRPIELSDCIVIPGLQDGL